MTRERVVPDACEGTVIGRSEPDLNEDIVEVTLSSGCVLGSITNQGRMLIVVPSIWLMVSIVAMAIPWLASSPVRCIDMPACAARLKEDSFEVHHSMLWGLCAFGLHEVWNLVVTYRVARPLVNFIDNVMDAFFPHVLVVFMLCVLWLENYNYSLGPEASLMHVGGGGGQRGFQPVLTCTIIEWLINVPILLVLAGHGMGRTLKEVSFAVIMTNIYICLSWWSYFVVHDFFRFFLVFVSFAMYTIVSVDMYRWTVDFRQSRMYLSDSRQVRQFMCYGLIVIFGIYGVIFLLSMGGAITSATERWMYTVMNAGTKFLYALTYATLRLISYHESIVDQIVNRPMNWQRGGYDQHEPVVFERGEEDCVLNPLMSSYSIRALRD